MLALRPAPRAVRARLLGRRRSRAPHRRARRHRDRLAQPVRPQHVPAAPPRGARRLQAGLHDPEPAGLPGRAEARRHGVGLRRPGQFHRPRRGDLRHLVRRRDQEVGVHHPELPAARQERAAHARLGQCRAEGRRGDLLRPERHRQDHAVGRSVAHPDRRRRARLGREQPLQLRGRLLRQGDQAEPRGRARDLRHHRALRHGAGERRDRPGDRRRSTSTTAAIPRTRAPAIRSNSFPTPRRPASPTRRRTSSC